MSHRNINNVGYKKIYPMSIGEDESFCHYCGHFPNFSNGLEWDHVPPLNVRIPEGCDEVRKTLVRSCSECNRLAADLPHMDYLERHFWLKGKYLRRHKKQILSESDQLNSPLGSSEGQTYENNSVTSGLESVLARIGFGVKDLEDIDSPILGLKTKKGRKVSTLLFKHLTGYPTEEDLSLIHI